MAATGAERSRAWRERRKAEGLRLLHGRFVAEPARPRPPEHGANGYAYRGCRCRVCRDGINEAQRERRLARLAPDAVDR